MSQHAKYRDQSASMRRAAALLAAVALLCSAQRSWAAGSDSCAGATVVSQVPFADTTDNSAFTLSDAGDPTFCGSFNDYSMWYSFTLPATGCYRADTLGTSIDTYLKVAQTTTANCGIVNSFGYNCDDNTGTSFGWPLTSMAGFCGSAGQTFLIMVSSKSGATGNVSVNITSGHESVVLPKNPTKATIRSGQASVVKTMKFAIRNADANEPAGHQVYVLVAEQNCNNVTLSQPDFDSGTPGAQNPAQIEGEQTKTVRFTATYHAVDVTTPNELSPQRCWTRVCLDFPTDFPDENDSNNCANLFVDVLDQNDF